MQAARALSVACAGMPGGLAGVARWLGVSDSLVGAWANEHHEKAGRMPTGDLWTLPKTVKLVLGSLLVSSARGDHADDTSLERIGLRAAAEGGDVMRLLDEAMLDGEWSVAELRAAVREGQQARDQFARFVDRAEALLAERLRKEQP